MEPLSRFGSRCWGQPSTAALGSLWMLMALGREGFRGASTLLGATCRLLPWPPARRRCRARMCQRREILGANPTGGEASGTLPVLGACGAPGGTPELSAPRNPWCQRRRVREAAPWLRAPRDTCWVLGLLPVCGAPCGTGAVGTPRHPAGIVLALSHRAVARCRGHAAAGTSGGEKPRQLPEGCVAPGWHGGQRTRGDAGPRAGGPLLPHPCSQRRNHARPCPGCPERAGATNPMRRLVPLLARSWAAAISRDSATHLGSENNPAHGAVAHGTEPALYRDPRPDLAAQLPRGSPGWLRGWEGRDKSHGVPSWGPAVGSHHGVPLWGWDPGAAGRCEGAVSKAPSLGAAGTSRQQDGRWRPGTIRGQQGWGDGATKAAGMAGCYGWARACCALRRTLGSPVAELSRGPSQRPDLCPGGGSPRVPVHPNMAVPMPTSPWHRWGTSAHPL